MVFHHPRDIPQFKEAVNQIQCDKLWVKYYIESTAYNIVRNSFLKISAHSDTRYKYLVILPDDLIPNQEAFDLLCKDAEKYDFPIISGICNLDWARQNIYTPKLSFGTAKEDYFVTNETLPGLVKEEPIRKVKCVSFACTFIRRDVVEDIEFGNRDDCAKDFEFEKDCERLGIDIHCDLRAKMLHRSNVFGDSNFEHMFLNIKPPAIIYEKWKEGKNEQE